MWKLFYKTYAVPGWCASLKYRDENCRGIINLKMFEKT
jgi:hypothetical protein